MGLKWFMLIILGAFLFGCNYNASPAPTSTLIFEITPRRETRARVPTQAPIATGAPAPTLAPQPTEDTGTAQAPDAFGTARANADATMRARATASPFPTAPPAYIELGNPARVTAQRDGLKMRVEIAQDSVLAGEGARAEITLENAGPDSIAFVGGPDTISQIVLLDERGHEPAPYPWARRSMPGESRMMVLKPGDTFTETVSFQLPSRNQIGEHSLVLWGVARFSRAVPENGNFGDNFWLNLEAGPLPLQLAAPNESDALRAELAMDSTGWFLRVTDANGNAVNPTWGALEMQVSNPNGHLYGLRNLPPRSDGTWQDRWDEFATPDSSFAIRAWAAAPNHTIVTATKIITSSGDLSYLMRDSNPEVQEFSTLDAAQDALGVPLARIHPLPAHTVLANVRAEISRYDHQQRIDTHELFRVGDDLWFELTQLNNTEKYDSAGWGQARYEADAQQVDVSGARGYVIQRLGWRVLDWKRGEVGFELRAPAEKFSEAKLLEIARAVQLP